MRITWWTQPLIAEVCEEIMPAAGKVTQVIGSTFDAEFPEDQLPEIHDATRVEVKGLATEHRLISEVQQPGGSAKIH